MNILKKWSLASLYILVSIIVLTFITTLLSYFDIISSKTTSLIEIMIIIISFLIGGFKLGKKSNKSGWLEGLKLSFVVCVILVLINYLIISKDFIFKDLLFYIIIIGSITTGSMIGINRKKS